jgi:hypothetical protein
MTEPQLLGSRQCCERVCAVGESEPRDRHTSHPCNGGRHNRATRIGHHISRPKVDTTPNLQILPHIFPKSRQVLADTRSWALALLFGRGGGRPIPSEGYPFYSVAGACFRYSMENGN